MKRLSAKSPPSPSPILVSSLKMPLYVRDRIVLPPYLKVELLGAIFSAIAYGIVIVLSGNCFYLLVKKWHIYPNRMRIILPIYVIVMLITSTWKIIGSIYIFIYNLASKDTSCFVYSFGFPFVLSTWGADGFMVRILIIFWEQRFTMQLQIWRCIVLYQDVSTGLRVGIIVLLSLISFASSGRKIYISTPPHSNCL